MKVMLILVDGMRPDALADIPAAQELARRSAHTLSARTVYPSVTLPCHMSLFHSVDPQRHGTTTNTHTPQVRPIDGLCDVLKAGKRSCGMFYNWEELRDLSCPGALRRSVYVSGAQYGYETANAMVEAAALESLRTDRLDFLFVYLGWPDEAGHDSGWMSGEYLRAVRASWDAIDRLIAAAGEEYTVIVTADHGGHDRTHGTTMDEDMTIPLFLLGPAFAPGSAIADVSIKDIAPTICRLLGVEPSGDWDGKALV